MADFYNFGESFNYDFFVRDGDGGFEDLSTVTDAPSIFVFSDRPTRQQAIDGTNAVESIASWLDLTQGDNKGKRISVSAIADPAPTSETEGYTYYIAINYKLVNSGTSILVLRAIAVKRPRVTHAPVSSAQTDLQRIYSDIDDIATSDEQDDKIVQATRDVKNLLEGKGFEWAELWHPKDLNDAISYLAVSYIMYEEMLDSGDQWEVRAKVFERNCENSINRLNLLFADANKQTEPASVQKVPSYMKVIR